MSLSSGGARLYKLVVSLLPKEHPGAWGHRLGRGGQDTVKGEVIREVVLNLSHLWPIKRNLWGRNQDITTFKLASRVETSLMAKTVKNLHVMQETQTQSLNEKDPLEKGMATHSSQRLGGYSPWGHKDSDTTEWLTLSGLRTTGLNLAGTFSVMVVPMQSLCVYT